MYTKEEFTIDFQEYSGMLIERAVERLRTTPEAFYSRVNLMVQEKIKEYNPKIFDFENDIPTYQVSAYKKAILEQALYLVNAGDASLMTGYDPVTNLLIPIDELRKRQFSPLAKSILLSSGLLNTATKHANIFYGDLY